MIKAYREQTIPPVSRQPGFRGVYLMTKPDGQFMVMNIWYTEAQANAWPQNPEHQKVVAQLRPQKLALLPIILFGTHMKRTKTPPSPALSFGFTFFCEGKSASRLFLLYHLPVSFTNSRFVQSLFLAGSLAFRWFTPFY